MQKKNLLFFSFPSADKLLTKKYRLKNYIDHEAILNQSQRR